MAGKKRRDFWEFVDKQAGENACWLWKGRTGGSGYGIYSPEVGTHVGAHRFAWSLTNGTIPEGMFACHHCDNPICVNPSHIFIGTPRDNVQDMIRKGRAKFNPSTTGAKLRRKANQGKPSGRKFGKGAAHPSHKLEEDDVVVIRQFAGILRNSEIAKIYRLSRQTVGSIVNREYWPHVA